VALAAGLWVVAGLVAYTSGFVVEGPEGGGLSVVQSLYIMVQILSTVGYGDYVPRTQPGMVFSSIYVLYSSLLVSAVVTEGVSRLVEQQHERAQHVYADMFDDGDPNKESFMEKYMRLFTAALVFSIAIFVWMMFYMFFCDPPQADAYVHIAGAEECEDRTTVEAFYMATVTLTTLGFGDVTPRTAGGEVFFCVWSLVGIATYVNLVSAITEKLLKARQSMMMDNIRDEDINLADADGSGSVDLYEFTRLILTRYKAVAPGVFDEIKRNFQDLDADGSGMLTAQDVQLIVKGGKRGPAQARAA